MVSGLTATVKVVDLASSAGAGGVGFLPSGTSALARTLADKARDLISVLDYRDSSTATQGDGVTDDYGMFSRALAANPGKRIFCPDPPVRYRNATAKLILQTNTELEGATHKTTQLSHEFNGDMFEMGDGASVINFKLPGNGATYTGKCFQYSGTNGRQLVSGVQAQGWSGPVEYYEYGAGSQCLTFDSTLSRINAGTGTGLTAVVIDPTAQLTAVPRGFVRLETDGTCAFNFGGCNDVFVTGSFLGDLVYTPNSRGVLITSSRIANQAALTYDGHNNVIDACDINPQITIASGADNVHLGVNSYNSLPIIDNSGNARNTMTHWSIAYTPVLTSGGTAPSLGNGTITGNCSRMGGSTQIDGQLTLGSTTTLGTGGLFVSLPQQRNSGSIFVGGAVVMSRSGTTYTGVLQIAGGVATAAFLRDSTGSVTYNSPGVFASGDTLRWSATYTN